MPPRPVVLMVHECEQPLAALDSVLRQCGRQTVRSRSLGGVSGFFRQNLAPDVVFTDLSLSDGTWADVIRLAGEQSPPLPVVVVSKFMDFVLYVGILEAGGFDFLVPPFDPGEIDFVLKCVTNRASVPLDQGMAPKGQA